MINGLTVRQATTRCDTCCHAGVENHRNNNAKQAICQHSDRAKVSTSVICNSWCSSINLTSCSAHLYWWIFSSEKVFNKSFGILGAIASMLSIAQLDDINSVIQMALMPTLTQARRSAVSLCLLIALVWTKYSVTLQFDPSSEICMHFMFFKDNWFTNYKGRTCNYGGNSYRQETNNIYVII